MNENLNQRQEYIQRINRVLDYIDANLDKSLTLKELADVAHFSQYHFHRIFGVFFGEPLNQYIWRIRLERAAEKLLNNPKKSVTEIALDLGFSDSAVFARKFKTWSGMSASDWRSGGYRQHSKIRQKDRNNHQPLSNNGKAFEVTSSYLVNSSQSLTWRIQMKTESQLTADVQVRNLDEMTVAYVRHVGPYQQNEELFGSLIEKLCKWAGPRDLLRFPETQMMAVYHDNPEITEDDKLRLSMCITVPKDTEVDGEVGKMTIPGGKYAMAKFELSSDQYADAWKAVYSGWLPESGYQPADGVTFELYLNDPKEHPEGKCIVEICIPVKPL